MCVFTITSSLGLGEAGTRTTVKGRKLLYIAIMVSTTYNSERLA